ncbi:M15 family metallopeptidase [Streptomyces sp. AK02-01A]|uniref:M15 family metallopeptidase n=1 Tax=Streptomyces sp. AK02-01A TaxID=3028648 RepID=UPI0029A6BC6E|nr:M15 family metallopeptidase [Streptomyces sp. AK02-01A]MDX3853437.1 M15 family metallopeptidase [Streptomyces sp. AK02-01A]
MREFIDRRRVLATGAGLGAATALAPILSGTAQAEDSGPSRVWNGTRSANGWPVLDNGENFTIEGSGLSVRLAAGSVAVILLHVARRFHYEINQLREGDVRGHIRSRNILQRYESNHLSGTAVAIRPDAFPAGVKGGLYPYELVVVRDILTELDGVVAWGGDFATPKESHFEIAYRPEHPKVKGVARKIQGWDSGPGGEGAGATDAFDPRRQARARDFVRRTG